MRVTTVTLPVRITQRTRSQTLQYLLASAIYVCQKNFTHPLPTLRSGFIIELAELAMGKDNAYGDEVRIINTQYNVPKFLKIYFNINLMYNNKKKMYANIRLKQLVL